MDYLRELVTKRGVSGDEGEVREYILEVCNKLADQVKVDALGNIIAAKRGETYPKRRMMGCAHMDEIGLIITRINDSGMLNFTPVGGMDKRILPSQRVLIGEKRIQGVIGMPPIHHMKREDIDKPMPLERMTIDIGAKDKKDAERLVSLGDTVIFDGEPHDFGDELFKSRALDDRVGCAILLKALEKSYPVTFIAVFAVQEEVGTRGAKVASYSVKPDAAIVLEGTTCADMHGVPDHLRVTRIGKGAAIFVRDRATVPDENLRNLIIETANEEGIMWQNREGTFGGTDAGAIQRARDGVSVSHIACPCRYIHSPVSVMSKRDFAAASSLFIKTLERAHQFIKGADE